MGESGPRSALLLVHGDFSDGQGSWGPLLKELGPRHRAVAVDRPGFAVPSQAEAGYSIAGEAGTIASIATEMGLDTFHLVGHSYGGLIALQMALDEPGRIRSLHLIEPPLLDLLPDYPAASEMARRVAEIQAEWPRLGDNEATARFFAMIGAQHTVDRLQGTDDWRRLSGFAGRFARNQPAGDYPSQQLDRLAPEIPVSVYSGGRSHPALRAVAAELAVRLGAWALIDVPNAGHAVQNAGEAFSGPLLRLVCLADAVWPERPSRGGSKAGGEERAL